MQMAPADVRARRCSPRSGQTAVRWLTLARRSCALSLIFTLPAPRRSRTARTASTTAVERARSGCSRWRRTRTTRTPRGEPALATPLPPWRSAPRRVHRARGRCRKCTISSAMRPSDMSWTPTTTRRIPASSAGRLPMPPPLIRSTSIQASSAPPITPKQAPSPPKRWNGRAGVGGDELDRQEVEEPAPEARAAELRRAVQPRARARRRPRRRGSPPSSPAPGCSGAARRRGRAGSMTSRRIALRPLLKSRPGRPVTAAVTSCRGAR